MCLRPLTIRNNSVYVLNGVTKSFNTVPCGKCRECREMAISEWRTRLTYSIYDTYKRGGKCIFLTFTYNDIHLPTLNLNGEVVKVFNHNDVKKFLNVLKVNAWRRFGKGSYRYFFVSEYGSDTQRPHYHCLFFLSKGVDFHEFTELCRGKWEHGFLFPKFDARKGHYVDNFGNYITPELRDQKNSAKYISKYITKDPAFFQQPFFKNLPKREKWKYREYFPKHFQSNFIGYEITNFFDINSTSSVKEVINHGVFNPYEDETTSLPRYVRNKIFYTYVKSTRESPTSICRRVMDPLKRPVYLYNRIYSEYGEEYKFLSMKNICNRNVTNYKNIYENNKEYFIERGLVCSDLDFLRTSLFSMYYKDVDNDTFNDILIERYGDISFIDDVDYTLHRILQSSNFQFVSSHPFHINNPQRSSWIPRSKGITPFEILLYYGDFSHRKDLLWSYYFERYTKLLDIFSTFIQRDRTNYFVAFDKKQAEIQRYRRMYKCKYDKKYA